jgi:hypothetical protein
MYEPRDLLALNEALARRVNESIERGVWPGEREAPIRFRCECADPECNQMVEMTIDEYEHVRSDPRRFFVVNGHERAVVDVVTERQAGYLIVEKGGEPGELARATDPRS